MPNIRQAFDFFVSSNFKSAVDLSTQSSRGGKWLLVELFDDGGHRVLWSNTIGNRYNSPGLILSVPSLGDAGDYDDAKQALCDSFSRALANQ